MDNKKTGDLHISSNFSEDMEVAKVNRNDLTSNYLNIDESSISHH
jgi:hypothetical protein